MCETPEVLIVDESPADREMVDRAVRQAVPGARVTGAGDAETFDRVLRTAAPDLVVTDYCLPWGNGLDVIRRVRSRWPECAVLMVTGNGDEGVAVDAMKLGASDYILKSPAHLLRLPSAIRAALQSRADRLATRHAELRYRSLFEHLPIAVYRSTFDGTIVDANKAFAALIGWPSPAAAVGQSASALYVDPDERQDLTATLRRTGEVRDRLVRLRRLDGDTIWVDLTVRVQEDEAGGYVMQGMARNVTDELAAQQQLRLLASALEAAVDAIVITDPSGVIEWANPSFTTMTGYAIEEVRGKKPNVLKSGAHDEAFYRDMWRTILDGDVWMGELENRRKDGRVYAEQMSITPVRDRDGAVAHFVAVKRDISAQRTLEAQFRQAQKMEAIGQLAGGIAHDFNNLMTAILGYCEILLEQIPTDDPNHGDVQEIRSAGVRASSLTRQLLAFSRKQILQPATFDVRGPVAGLDKMLRRVIREDIALSIVHADRPLYVRADIGQVEQVLINLVINASDAMPGGGALTVSTRAETLDDDFVREHPGATKGPFVAVEVRDTGTGMPPDVLARIFEPFFTTKPQGKGTGLGLSMVYGIVKQSGGYVGARSEPGAGSVFTVYLPEADAPASVETVVSQPRKEHASSSASILVAEDDATIRDLVCRVLSRSGYNVVAGGSAREALESLETFGRRPDLLLTDVIMPDTNGIEFARVMRARHPMLPIIFMSGYHDLSDVSPAEGTSAGRLLQKPVSPEALLQAVHESLGTIGSATGYSPWPGPLEA
jgi:PAS domain S-box-containing protein